MAAKTNFRGSFTALVTPFKNGSVDEQMFRDIVEWQITEGTNGLVPVGTTGESPTLSHDEHKQVVEWCIDQTKGRVPVVAGAGSNSTREAVELARHAEKAGAGGYQGVLDKLNQAGLGTQVQSWLNTNGKNLPVSPAQIEAALGNQQLQQLAASFGVPLDQISNLLSTHLPAAVDQASPTGTLQK